MTMSRSGIVRVGLLGLPLLALATYGGYWWKIGRHLEDTDNAYVRADISEISSRITGQIGTVYVQENQPVKAGDPLLDIDASDYQAKVDDAQAQVQARTADLRANAAQQDQQVSTVTVATTRVAAAVALSQKSSKELARTETLLRDGVATRQRLENARAADTVAEADVARAQAELSAARQQGASLSAEQQRLQADLAAAQAHLNLARIDLAATRIQAPIDGLVGNLAARVGERVGPNSRLLSVVPTASRYVVANFKETQIGAMLPGQTATIRVDAFPGEHFAGHIDSLSPASGAEFALLPATNASGNFTKIVQRIPVRITLDDPRLRARLVPGMSVNVVVDTRAGAKAAVAAATPEGEHLATATR